MVPALPGQVQLAVLVEVEGNVHVDELADVLGTLVHQHMYRRLVAQSRARHQRVPEVELRVVVRRRHRRDAPLGQPGAGDIDGLLGEHTAGEGRGEVQRAIKPRDPGPHNDHVIIGVPLRLHRPVNGVTHHSMSFFREKRLSLVLYRPLGCLATKSYIKSDAFSPPEPAKLPFIPLQNIQDPLSNHVPAQHVAVRGDRDGADVAGVLVVGAG